MPLNKPNAPAVAPIVPKEPKEDKKDTSKGKDKKPAKPRTTKPKVQMVPKSEFDKFLNIFEKFKTEMNAKIAKMAIPSTSDEIVKPYRTALMNNLILLNQLAGWARFNENDATGKRIRGLQDEIHSVLGL